MSNQPITLDLSVVRLRNNDVVTDSRKVASVFGKQHKNIIQRVEQLDCSSEFFAANFSATKYQLRGREYKNYEITKDGFMFLVALTRKLKRASISLTRIYKRLSAPVSLAVFLRLLFGASSIFDRVERRNTIPLYGNMPGASCKALVETRSPITSGWLQNTKIYKETAHV